MSDNAGNKIEGENEKNSEYAIRKETESRFPTPEALCYLVPSVKENVSASCQTNTRAACTTGCYLGAREATICSKQGSPRSGSHHGINFSSP